MEADLSQLKLILSLFERYDSSISTNEIYAELSERLREELDYSREARNMALYRLMLAGEAGVHVPETLDDLSTRRLLTMTWIEGAPIAGFDAAPLEIRNALAMNVFRAWYSPFYDYGVIHGDPHFGNYTVRPDYSINLLDFGCIRVFHARFVGAVIDLYKALMTDDDELAVHAYTVWGFKNLSREMIEALNIWARFLYAPVMDNRRRKVDEAGNGNYGREQVQKVHGELKRLGGITPPREFVFMDRAAVGLGALFLRLKADINWYEMFHTLIDGFDVSALEQRQTKALTETGLTLPL